MLFCRCGCVTKLGYLCLADSLATKLKNFNFIVEWVSEVTFGLLLLRFGHEIRCCFAVADASQCHAAYAWQARWRQNWKVKFIVRFQKWREALFGVLLLGFWARNWVLLCRCGCVTKPCSLCLAGSLATKRKSQFYKFYSRVSKVTLIKPFFGFPGLRFGHEIGCCFAVADASQSHAACAWQARWPQNGKVNL